MVASNVDLEELDRVNVDDIDDDAAQVFVAGKKGTGKSTVLKDILLAHLEETPDRRFVAWDTCREFLEIPGRLIVLDHMEWDGFDAVEYALSLGDCTFVCDEFDKLAPNAGSLEGPVHELIHRGRHWRVGSLTAARRPVNIHRDVTSQADAIFFFRARDPRDVKWVREVAGEEWAQAVQRLGDHQWVRCNC